jgi:uncharacterized protein (DUF1810 family)
VTSSWIERHLGQFDKDFCRALSEIEEGQKRCHWMWWIFPMAKGLGNSDRAKEYAIESLDEAVACLAHPAFGDRYCRIVDAVWSQVAKCGTSVKIMFPRPDDRKLVSSRTLFRRAAENLAQLQRPESDRRAFSLLVDQSTEILERAQGEGLDPCSRSQGLE